MNNKTLSIVSYITLIGWLIAFFVDKEQADDLRKYHLKQSFGLFIVSVIINIASFIVLAVASKLSFIFSIIGILLLVLLIIGIINASNAAKKPLPVIGKMFEDKFSFIN